MASLLIICPTISGREETFDRCVKSYAETTSGHEIEFISPKDLPSWGKGINAGIEEVGDLDWFDYIHFTSDDIEAHDGWFDAAVEALDRSVYPAPLLLNPDGSVAGFGHGDANMMDTSRDWKPTLTSVIPTLTPVMWESMGPMINLMYFTDDYLSHKARLIGMESTAIKAYKFTHHHSEILPVVDGMSTRVQRLHHDQVLYQKYLTHGIWPEEA